MSQEQITILVVDDDISHCTILQALLRGWGYQVALANNGVQALEQIREQVFDLVLCDIRITGVHGGFGHGAMYLFAQEGELMATASQSLIVRVRD